MDYKLSVKVENANIIKAITDAGYNVGGKFCDEIGISYSRLRHFINMQTTPLEEDGFFKQDVIRLCEVLNKSPSDLFTDEQLTETLETNKAELYLDKESLSAVLGGSELSNKRIEQAEVVDSLLEKLRDRERYVIDLLYVDGLTLEEAGEEMGVTAPRVRQIQQKALSKLRHAAGHNKEIQSLVSENSVFKEH